MKGEENHEFNLYLFGIIFTIVGFMFACGKGHIHLSSWKNMPREEKERSKLCRFAVTSVKSLH